MLSVKSDGRRNAAENADVKKGSFPSLLLVTFLVSPSCQIVHPSRVFKLAPIYSRILCAEIFPNHLGTGQTVKIEGTFDHTRGHPVGAVKKKNLSHPKPPGNPPLSTKPSGHGRAPLAP
jgi:hypothetical protein